MSLTGSSWFASGEGFDPDAKKFIDAVEGGGDMLTETEKTAINNYVIALKDAGVYSPLWDGYSVGVHKRLWYLYPLVGGTSTSTKWNLADPRDLNAAYRVTWNGTPTFASTGVTGNGTNAYGNTHFLPSVVAANPLYYKDSTSWGYIRSNSTFASQICAWGALGGSLNRAFFGSTSSKVLIQDFTNYSPTIPSNYGGVWMMSRRANNDFKSWIDTDTLSTDTTTYATTPVNTTQPFVLLARNNNGTIANYFDRECSSFGNCDGLDDTTALAVINADISFQTELGRNI